MRRSETALPGDGSADSSPVAAKAALVDGESLEVTWLNEAAARDAGLEPGALSPPVDLETAIPLAETLGLPAALAEALRAGAPTHVRADLVSTSRGKVAIAGSVYPLPDGSLLVITEHAWQPGHRSEAAESSRRSASSRKSRTRS